MKQWKSLLALLLALTMVFGLAACGKGGENSQGGQSGGKQTGAKETPTPEFVYVAEYQKVEGDNENNRNFYPSLTTDRGFYGTRSIKVGEREPEEGEVLQWEGQFDIYEEQFVCLSFDGKLSQLTEYKQMETEKVNENAEVYTYNEGMGFDAEGNLVLVTAVNQNWSDAPAGVEPYTDEWYRYFNHKTDYYLRKLDGTTGAELSATTMNVEGLENEYGDFYLYNAVPGPNGTIICVSEGGLYIFDIATGSCLGTVEIGQEQWVDTVIRLSDGNAAVSVSGQNGMSLKLLDLDAMKLGEELPLGSYVYNTVPGSGQYLFYYQNGTSIYGYDKDRKEGVRLFNWLSLDVDSSAINGFGMSPDGTLVALSRSWEMTGEGEFADMELVKVVQKPYDEVPHKTTLTLATQGLSYNAMRQLLSFNRSSDSYHIEVRDYSEYNNETDGWDAGATKLKTEIMAGNMPDILDLSGLPGKQLAAKGLLADLGALLDSDAELGREDFFPNVLAASTEGDVLYMIPASFTITTLAGASRAVGDTPGWTYQQLMEALRNMPEGCTVFNRYTQRGEILNTMMALYMDDFVDWGTGKVNFESQDFIDMLNFAKDFPAEIDWENMEWTEEDDENYRLGAGLQLVTQVGVYGYRETYNFLYMEQMFGGGTDSFTYIGYPTSSGNGAMMNLQDRYAISSRCADKDAAWSFLRVFLTADYQGGSNNWGIPSRIDCYEKQKKEAMTVEYEKDDKGNYVLDENGQRVPVVKDWYYSPNGEQINFYAVTEEQAAKYDELVYGTSCVRDTDDAIYDIITEQAEAFFAGQKTAEEVARLVQSKANIYVNEQR